MEESKFNNLGTPSRRYKEGSWKTNPKVLAGLGLGGAILGGAMLRNEYNAPYNNTATEYSRAQQRGQTPMTQSYNQFVGRRKSGSVSGPKRTKEGGIGSTLMSAGKKAYENPLTTTGLIAGGLGIDAIEDAMQPISQTTGQQIASGMYGPAAASGISPSAEKQRARAQAMGRNMVDVPASTIQAATKELARSGAQAGARKAKQIARKPQQRRILQRLMKKDPQLQNLTPSEKRRVQQSFGTMQRFAPDLATDEFAAKNFLRESLISGSGPDYATISNIAQTNQQINR